MTSVSGVSGDAEQLQFNGGRIVLPVHSCIQKIFNNADKEGGVGASRDGFEFTAQALKVMPYNIKVSVFEYLSLDQLLELLNIDQDSCENIDMVKAVKLAIKSYLQTLLPKDWLKIYSVEDVLDCLMKLCSCRNGAKYSRSSLESFNNSSSLKECIELLFSSPLMMIEILSIRLAQEELSELEIELMLQIIVCGEEQINDAEDDIYDNSEHVEEIVSKCMLIAAKYNNMRILNLLNMIGLDVFRFQFHDEFLLVFMDNYSREFLKRWMEIKFTYQVLDIVNRIEAVEAFKNIISALVRVGDFELIREIIAMIPQDVKIACQIDLQLEECIQEMEEQNNSDEFFKKLNKIVKLWSEMGFR